MEKYRKNRKKSEFAIILAVVFFVAVLLAFFAGTRNLAQQATAEGAAELERAIWHAAILCYASEGFYPEGLNYIERHYGVQVNQEQYIVYYDIFASNIMPNIVVEIRG